MITLNWHLPRRTDDFHLSTDEFQLKVKIMNVKTFISRFIQNDIRQYVKWKVILIL